MKRSYNDFSESFDTDLHSKINDMALELKLLKEIRKKPYFLRLDYNDNKVYIGKNAIDGFVIASKDSECMVYDKSGLYINRKDYDIKLIREFKVSSGILTGYKDNLNYDS